MGDPDIRHSSQNLASSNTLEFYKKPSSHLSLNDNIAASVSIRGSSSRPIVINRNEGAAVGKKNDADEIISAEATNTKGSMERWFIENRPQDNGTTIEKRSVQPT